MTTSHDSAHMFNVAVDTGASCGLQGPVSVPPPVVLWGGDVVGRPV